MSVKVTNITKLFPFPCAVSPNSIIGLIGSLHLQGHWELIKIGKGGRME